MAMFSRPAVISTDIIATRLMKLIKFHSMIDGNVIIWQSVISTLHWSYKNLMLTEIFKVSGSTITWAGNYVDYWAEYFTGFPFIQPDMFGIVALAYLPWTIISTCFKEVKERVRVIIYCFICVLSHLSDSCNVKKILVVIVVCYIKFF